MPREAETNLLLALDKWATSQENFVTEAFSHLLRYLLRYDALAAVNLLRAVTGGRLAVNPQQAELVTVQAQVTTEYGTPDLVVLAPGQVVAIEVKMESDVDAEQLRGYQTWLAGQREEGAKTTLVLLTRYPVSSGQTKGHEDVRVRWCQVADWLGTELSRNGGVRNAFSVFLAEQFLTFLKGVNMTAERVGWELAAGVRSLMNLMDMLREAIASTGGAEIKKSAGAMFNGFDFSHCKKSCWAGLYYDQPETMLFMLWARPVDEKRVKELGFRQESDHWQKELDLSSEDAHFLALSKTKQFQTIERFLTESLSAWRDAAPATPKAMQAGIQE